MPNPKIPSKVKQEWRSYEPYGEPISINEEGFRFRFIAFKVPMELSWNLRRMVQDFPDLSLLIDLCATDKYYRLEDLENLQPDAQFRKIRGIGNPQAIPEDATINQ